MKKEMENTLDSKLWHACAGGIVQLPKLNSKVFYFPQGHAEHALTHVTFPSSDVIPTLILCRVSSIRHVADPETDEVFARLQLVPIKTNHILHDLFNDEDSNDVMPEENDNENLNTVSFAKTLTQSDANNGGGFSVPRYCAETIFPTLDYSGDPPVQTVIVKDLHGDVWKFRHIYRGTPRRHLLTTGWSTFVNHKKLAAGDSIVFFRRDSGNLRVGIRRAKRGLLSASPEFSPATAAGRWGHGGTPSSGFVKEEGGKMGRNVRVRAEEVVEAARSAAKGEGFEVVYYPRANAPEFCVKAEEAVRAAMRVQWRSGMRFKMAFETEDSSRISWFMGTIGGVEVHDRIHWPNSPWRILQVTWDEPHLLQNVKCVSPWLIELVSNFPIIPMAPFSTPRKKFRIPQFPDFTLDGQLKFPSFSGNPLKSGSTMCCLPDNTPAGIQGARHAQLGLSLLNPHFNNNLQLGLFSSSPHRFYQSSRIPNGIRNDNKNINESLSCSLKMGSSIPNLEKSDNVKKHQFFLFGQPILTEQQMSRSCATDAVSQVLSAKNLKDENQGRKRFMCVDSDSALLHWGLADKYDMNKEFNTLDLDTGHCKVLLESEDIGRTLDLSALGSYDELYRRLTIMFGLERPEMLSHVLYRDQVGVVKQTGDEPFGTFKKAAKRLTILTRPANEAVGRTWTTGMENAGNGLGASHKTGPLSLFV